MSECPTHSGETVIMVCKSCDNYPLVCGVCVEQNHAGHILQTLRTAAQSMRERLEQIEEDNVQVFDDIKSDLEDFTKMKDEENEKANVVESCIETQSGILHSNVNTMKETISEKLKVEVAKNMDTVEKAESTIKQQVLEIDTFQRKVAELQKMNNYVDIIVAGRDVEIPDTTRHPVPSRHDLRFTSGKVDDDDLGRMFGEVTLDGVRRRAFNFYGAQTACNTRAEVGDTKTSSVDGSSPDLKESDYIKVTSVSSFELSKNDGIDVICCAGSGVAWLKCENKNSLRLSNRSGSIKQNINLGTATCGFTVTSDDRPTLLFCCTNQKCVKEMRLPNGVITEKFSTSPLTPRYICTSPSGDHLVTLDNETDNSTGVMVRYDCHGRETDRCEHDENGKNIFVLPPRHVCVNNSDTRIAVINIISRSRWNHLLILNRELCTLMRYTGPSVLTGNSLKGFHLNDVKFDARDNIVVAEAFSGTVQLLSPTCEPLHVLLTLDTSPWSLGIHGHEVWVGDQEGGVRIIRYSIPH